MSRIQEILAKADRDGTARRLQPTSPHAAPASHGHVMTSVVDGSSALDTSSFAPAPPPPPKAEPRTAQATLHPALVAAIAPHSDVAEGYRAIRTRLMLREEAGPLRVIGISSAGPRDGKSITAANLALTMAQEIQRSVVLVDGNLRNPAVHALFAVERGPGFSELLTGDVTLDDALVYLPDFRLTLLTAGRVPEYPTELLGSTAMRRAIDALRTRFDRVLIDLPAVSPLADVRTVAPLVDGAVLVVRAGMTQRPALDQALAAFEDDKVLGVVLNETS